MSVAAPALPLPDLPDDVVASIGALLSFRTVSKIALASKTLSHVIWSSITSFSSDEPRSNLFIGEAHLENVLVLPRLHALQKMIICMHEKQDISRFASAFADNIHTLSSIQIALTTLESNLQKARADASGSGNTKRRTTGWDENFDDDEELPEDDDDFEVVHLNVHGNDGEEEEENGAAHAEVERKAEEPCEFLLRDVVDAVRNAACPHSTKLTTLIVIKKRVYAEEIVAISELCTHLKTLHINGRICAKAVLKIAQMFPHLEELTADFMDGVDVDVLSALPRLKKMVMGGFASILMATAAMPAVLADQVPLNLPAEISGTMLRDVCVRGPPALGLNVAIRLSHNEDVLRTVLQMGVSTGDPKTVEFMLLRGADPNNSTYLRECGRTALLHAYQAWNPSIESVFDPARFDNRRFAVLDKLLDFGADVLMPTEHRGASFLHHLINRGDVELLRRCLFEKRLIRTRSKTSTRHVAPLRGEHGAFTQPRQDHMFSLVTAILGVVAGVGADDHDPTVENLAKQEEYDFDHVLMTPFEFSKTLYASDEEWFEAFTPKDFVSLIHVAAAWLYEAPSSPLPEPIAKNKLALLKWLSGEVFINEYDPFYMPATTLFPASAIGTHADLTVGLFSPIHQCADPAAIDYLLGKGALVSGCPDFQPVCPLAAICSRGQTAAAKHLISKITSESLPAMINQALLYAYTGGFLSTIALLLQVGASLPELKLSAEEALNRKGDIPLVCLMSSLADTNPSDIEDKAALALAFEHAWAISSDIEKVVFVDEAFPISAEKFNVYVNPLNDVIVELLSRIDIPTLNAINLGRKRGQRPSLLMVAAAARSQSRVALLLKVCPYLLHEVDSTGHGVLHYITRPPIKGTTMEELSIQTKNIIDTLIAAGVDLTARDKDDKTAADLAAEAPSTVQGMYDILCKKTAKALRKQMKEKNLVAAAQKQAKKQPKRKRSASKIEAAAEDQDDEHEDDGSNSHAKHRAKRAKKE